MKALIIGSGKQAVGVAWYLVNHTDFEEIGLYSRSQGPMDNMIDFVGGERVKKHIGNVFDPETLKEVMQDYDVGINTLPDRKTSYRTIELAADVGLNMVDILEEYHRRPDPYEMEGMELPPGITVEGYGEELHERYQKKGIMLLDGMGFAPGITNFTLGEALREMDTPKTAIARCGGIPDEGSAERHPLKYMITWSFDHVLREYNIKSGAIKDGKRVELEALSLHERFRFDKFGKDVELECAVTPGMPSFPYTHPELEDTYEKTIRWPGHYDTIKEFKKCGLLDVEPIEVNGNLVVPREFLSQVITPRLQPFENDRDCCVMWNTAQGIMKGEDITTDIYMWVEEKNGLRAMQQTTGFPAAIGAEMLAKGELKGNGIIPPEDCIKGSLYLDMIKKLEAVGVTISKETNFL